MRAKLALPYGKFPTIIFKEFDVDMEGESFKKMKHFDTYDENSLKRMGFKKMNGQWTKVDNEEESVLVFEPMPKSAGPFVRPARFVCLEED